MQTQIWLWTIVSVVIVSLLSLIGVLTLALKRETLHKVLLFFVCFAVGALFGDAFIHLIPESFKQFGIDSMKTPVLILVGILIFFLMEKGIRWRTCHNEDHCEGHPKPFVLIILTGDTFHNFIDGMVIAASYAVDIKLGITTTIAVMLHEIPHEVGDFGALIHGGLTIKKALFFNFLSSLAAVLGAVVSLILGDVLKGYEIGLLPITAGGFIYLAGSDLLPELYPETGIVKSIIQFICILIGIGMMALLLLVG
ncbi:MAG: hypothetical protein A2231_09185 [Candidatus Firestonebacteria bacterium RIFOXYA2_FULL_40_8]|nr:MAG: hypothetical protein A2231_09185 [Candidatus Firestonebacteria bacterium RIFOXYA2_FULL_40_8]